MEQLVKLVMERTGLAEAQAREAVKVVVGFIKERLPEPIQAQFDTLLDTPIAGNVAEQALNTLGGLFGGKKES
ncbi:MAG TPA: DUF2267 domain-containing protein [Roseiflexaceae bacterium]|nr:DUF2267 domain-containing protein [Roseiflexaceae bacterium]HMP40512.1 DUF2267 domain-containing protein [Roseiflexaceae bacterium]